MGKRNAKLGRFRIGRNSENIDLFEIRVMYYKTTVIKCPNLNNYVVLPLLIHTIRVHLKMNG